MSEETNLATETNLVPKNWYKSTTIQGDVAVVIGLLVKVLDLPIITGEIEAVVSAVITVIGVVMVFIGRLKAKQPIK